MAPEDRPQSQHLGFLADVAREARHYGLFPVVRGAEARAKGLPRAGRARLPSQNVVDLWQVPTMSFPQTTLESVDIKAGRARVGGYWLGLTGPMGPMPTHITEFAFYERSYAKSQPFGRWLDVLAGRMLQLFYRAWADSQPTASADRIGDDRFGDYLAALSGAREGVTERSSFPAQARLHYAGLFAGSRSAAAIEDGLTHLLGQQTRLIEYHARWRHLEPEDVSRLGKSYATLGSDAVLGGRIRSGADAFRVVIRAKDFADYKSLLPTGTRFQVAAEALDAFKPSHIEWDLELEIEDSKAPPARLDGRTQLGWTGWIKRPESGKRKASSMIRADAHLRRMRRVSSGENKT